MQVSGRRKHIRGLWGNDRDIYYHRQYVGRLCKDNVILISYDAPLDVKIHLFKLGFKLRKM